MRALILCGVLQSAGNLFYVLQAVGGHRLDYRGLRSGGNHWRDGRHRAGGLSLRALLAGFHRDSVRAAVFAGGGGTYAGRVVWRGALADKFGWVPFFIMTTIATVPALLLLVWIARRDPASMRESGVHGGGDPLSRCWGGYPLSVTSVTTRWGMNRAASVIQHLPVDAF